MIIMCCSAAPIIVYDNLRVMYIGENIVHRTKMKYLEVNLHLFRTKSEMAHSEYRTSTLLIDGEIRVRSNF